MTIKCGCCDGDMRQGLESWHWQCPSCGYEASQFDVTINETSSHALMDEASREHGLKTLREGNFRDLLALIREHVPPGRCQLLDVGAAHGWFVKMASERMDALGIEPDGAMCVKARSEGISLIEGYFPDAISADAKFDVITFNDVFEHIPDVPRTFEACRKHLKDGGLLVLNLPSSDGFFYKTSKLLKRAGSRSAFERMWQKDLPSPHIHYFNPKNLVQAAEKNGFDRVAVASLRSVRHEGLYDRISHISGRGKLHNNLVFVATSLVIPLTGVLSSDIAVVILKKNSSARA
jgi:SAM-dependent methyltransferase